MCIYVLLYIKHKTENMAMVKEEKNEIENQIQKKEMLSKNKRSGEINNAKIL